MNGNDDDKVICHWFDTQQGRWRDDLVNEQFCVNQLHGTPQPVSPDLTSAARWRASARER
jgi:hypothetical protein